MPRDAIPHLTLSFPQNLSEIITDTSTLISTYLHLYKHHNFTPIPYTRPPNPTMQPQLEGVLPYPPRGSPISPPTRRPSSTVRGRAGGCTAGASRAAARGSTWCAKCGWCRPAGAARTAPPAPAPPACRRTCCRRPTPRPPSCQGGRRWDEVLEEMPMTWEAAGALPTLPHRYLYTCIIGSISRCVGGGTYAGWEHSWRLQRRRIGFGFLPLSQKFLCTIRLSLFLRQPYLVYWMPGGGCRVWVRGSYPLLTPSLSCIPTRTRALRCHRSGGTQAVLHPGLQRMLV